MSNSSGDEHLFYKEKEILQEAQRALSEGISGQGLLSGYASLVTAYEKLLRITKKAFYISDIQGKTLRRQQTEMQTLLDNSNQGFLTFSANLKVDRPYSAECKRILGPKIADATITALLAPHNKAEQARWEQLLKKVFSSEGNWQPLLQELPQRFQLSDRQIQAEYKLLSQGADTDALIMMILTDITEKVAAEEQIRYLSYHDKMTGLYNRAYMETLLSTYDTADFFPISIIILDMNGLKIFNDVFGHQQGDALLVTMARILEQCCRKQDVIARWGGDEFLIVMPRTNVSACRAIGDSIEAACEQTELQQIKVSAAMGYATEMDGPLNFTELFAQAENHMYSDKQGKKRELFQSFVAHLEKTLYDYCGEIPHHGERVRQLTEEFLVYLGNPLQEAEKVTLFQLAQFHDIGKAAIAAQIWNRPGKLSPEEWQLAKTHSDIGYRLANAIDEKELAEAILAHHEWWNGTGYPLGLAGEEIPLSIRIFVLADFYDTLLHERPYRAALSHEEALAEIEAAKGGYLDPKLAKEFLQYMAEQEK